MRLLKSNDDGSISLTSHDGDQIPPYAILSHTWGHDSDEITFQEVSQQRDSYKTKAGYKKFQFCQQQAISDGLRYFWIDTCCIDKSSSQELSEAINSMFRWYRRSARCYVYLSDVSTGTNGAENSQAARATRVSSLKRSRWFRRGWTLQELLAPKEVYLFSQEGIEIGSKFSLDDVIHDVTGIPKEALLGRNLSHFSPNERMSWAKTRSTKREEDSAYCLLGIFGVTMQPLYTEGRAKAFQRLREEIQKSRDLISPTPAKRQLFREGHLHDAISSKRSRLSPHTAQVESNSQRAGILWEVSRAQKIQSSSHASTAYSRDAPAATQLIELTSPDSGHLQVPSAHFVTPDYAGLANRHFGLYDDNIEEIPSAIDFHILQGRLTDSTMAWSSFTAPLTRFLRADISLGGLYGRWNLTAQEMRSLLPADKLSLDQALGNIVLYGLTNGTTGRHDRLNGCLVELYENRSAVEMLVRFVRGLEEPFKSILVDQFLPLAIEARNHEAVKALILLGASPNAIVTAQDREFSALGRAAFLGSLETVRILLEAKADPNLKPSIGFGGALLQMLTVVPLQKERSKVSPHAECSIALLLVQSGGAITADIMNKAMDRRNHSLVMHLASFAEHSRFDGWITPKTLETLMINFTDEEGLEILCTVQNGVRIRESNNPGVSSIMDLCEAHLHKNILVSGTALDLAAANGHFCTFNFLKKIGLECSERTLVYAILGKSKPLIRSLLGEGQDCYAGVRLGWCRYDYLRESVDSMRYDASELRMDVATITPFCAAVLSNDEDIFSWVVARNGIQDITDDDRFYPAITAASILGQTTLLENLLQRKSHLDSRRLRHPMLRAILAGHTEIALRLITLGARPSSWLQDDALLEAVKQKNHTLVLAILEVTAGLSREELDKLWRHVMHWGHIEVIEAMQRAFPNYDRLIEFTLLKNNTEHTIQLVGDGKDISLSHKLMGTSLTTSDSIYDSCGDFTCCLLATALFCKNFDIAQLVARRGADPDCPGTWMGASQNEGILSQLVKEFTRRNGYRKTIQASRGLMFAIAGQNENAVTALASICDVDHLTFRPCVDEIKRRMSNVESRLLQIDKRVAPVGEPKEDEYDFYHTRLTAFAYAILHDHTENLRMIRTVLKAAGNLQQAATSTQHPPLCVAVTSRSLPKVRFLVENGAEVNRKPCGSFARTPLQYAVEKGVYDIVKYLLEQGADPNLAPVSNGGATAFQLAAIQGYMGIADLLIEFGADIHAPACAINGRTALEGAAEYNRVAMVQYLVEKGVNVRGEGSTQLERAIHFARQEKHLTLCKYLESLRHPPLSLE